MSAHPPVADQLTDTADQISVPHGYRVEIVDGVIIVSPTRRGWEALNTASVHRVLRPVLGPGLVDVEMVSLDLPETRQRYVPDVVVLPHGMVDAGERLIPASSAVLVAEVTAPGRAEINRVKKLHGYITSAVPAYLLVDRDARSASLFTEPDGQSYRRHLQVPFGAPIDLPSPFTGSITTAHFV